MGFNIKMFRKSLGYSQISFSNELDLAQPYLSEMENGKKPVSEEVINKIHERFGKSLTEGWFKEDAQAKNENDDEDRIEYLQPVPDGAFAGNVMGYSPQEVDSRNIQMVPSPVRGCDLAINISGRSMEPDFPDGCHMFVRRIDDDAFIAWGNPFVVDTTNGAFLKKLYPEKNDTLEARSINPEYPAFDIPKRAINGIYRVIILAKAFHAS